MTNCPLCGGTAQRRFERHGYFIRDCNACGHRFAELTPSADHVRDTYGDAYFNEGGAGYSGYLKEGPMLRDYGRWYAGLSARYMQPGRVLDVGCAAGFWLAGFCERGWQPQGIEPNATMAAFARAELGLTIRTASFEEVDSAEPLGLVSLVAMIQVIPHFRDPRRAITLAHSLLAADGYLLLETWDREHWISRMLGARWQEYSPPSVLHWFSRASLRRLGEECGFEFVAAGKPRKRISLEHARELLRHKYTNPLMRAAVAAITGSLPDAASLPYPGGDVFWMLLRKSTAP